MKKILVLLVGFGIAALLKTAQGSSTVAIITTSSIMFPLLPLLNLDSDLGKVWVIMALGVGSMTVSHANDSYFWIVSQMSGMDVKTAYRTHTMGTLLQGVIGFFMRRYGFSVVPLAIGLILGGMLEQRLGQSMVMLDEHWWLMFTRPLTLFFFILTALALFGPALFGTLKRRLSNSTGGTAE